MSKFKSFPLLENLEITDTGAEGQGVAKTNGPVIFINKTIPGDIVNAQIIRKKKNYIEARLVNIIKPSPYRVTPQCPHFDVCGGCKWQNMQYAQQLYYKQKLAQDALIRIGKVDVQETLPILGSENIFYYRNKLDYGFTNKRWLFDNEKTIQESGKTLNINALGFHIPGRFDKIFNVTDCRLQPDYGNKIRNAIFEYANQKNLPFFDLKSQEGFLRSLIIRNNLSDQWMVIVSFKENRKREIHELMDFLLVNFPKIISLYYVVNPKRNETIFDLDLQLYHGEPFLTEELNGLKFKINPKSFFQTNPAQAHHLYELAFNFAELTGTETVYDLYTGTGTIANYLAPKAQKVVGIEYVEEAIIDARENSKINNISNTLFFSGDMKDVLNTEFVKQNGKPHVIVADPPRAGMHELVVKRILEIEPQTVVYVSCNPSTQARDLSLLQEKYKVTKSRAVDMFPHTQHVENVVQLKLR